MKKEHWCGWNRPFSIDMRAEEGGIIVTSVEEIFECWKTTGRNKSPKWDGTYLDVVWWRSVTDCLGREGGVWALNSYFLYSWGLFIHLEGTIALSKSGSWNIQGVLLYQFLQTKPFSGTTVSINVVGKERSRLLRSQSFRGLFRAAECLQICGTEWDTLGGMLKKFTEMIVRLI